jgi:hypothetical protein
MGAGMQNSVEGKKIELYHCDHVTSTLSVGQFYCRQVQTTIIDKNTFNKIIKFFLRKI